MIKTILGIEPYIFIKDGAKVTFSIDLSDKEYTIENITQATFIFSQDEKTYVYYSFSTENESQDVIIDYDEASQKIYLTLNFGAANTDTSAFCVGKPINFEIALEIALSVEDSSEVLDSMMVETKTIIEKQPSIILVENTEASVAYHLIRSVGE